MIKNEYLIHSKLNIFAAVFIYAAIINVNYVNYNYFNILKFEFNKKIFITIYFPILSGF